MDTTYAIAVTDSEGETIIAGEGKVYVFYYVAEKAALELEELGSDHQVTALITHGEKTILNATIDAESAASLIKGRSLKVRRSLAETSAAETPAS